MNLGNSIRAPQIEEITDSFALDWKVSEETIKKIEYTEKQNVLNGSKMMKLILSDGWRD